MMTPLILVTACIFLFGLVWHNQPSRDRERAADGSHGSDPDDSQSSSERQRPPAKPRTENQRIDLRPSNFEL